MSVVFVVIFFFFKQKTAYEMRISDWSSDVCSSDLIHFYMRPVVARDLANEQLDVNQFYACLAATPKHVMANAYLPEKVAEQRALAEMLAGGADSLDRRPLISYTRSEEHTSELQSLMRISYAVFCLKQKHNQHYDQNYQQHINHTNSTQYYYMQPYSPP